MPPGSKIKELIYIAKLDQCLLQEISSGDTSCMLSPIVLRMATFLLRSGPEGIKLFSCSTQRSTKFQPINTKIPTNKEVSNFKSLRCCIYHANKCENANIVGILTFMSKINFLIN